MRKSYAVHPPRGDLDDSHTGGGEEGVQARSFGGGRFGPEAELTGLAVAADIDVEFCCWWCVERS